MWGVLEWGVPNQRFLTVIVHSFSLYAPLFPLSFPPPPPPHTLFVAEVCAPCYELFGLVALFKSERSEVLVGAPRRHTAVHVRSVPPPPSPQYGRPSAQRRQTAVHVHSVPPPPRSLFSSAEANPSASPSSSTAAITISRSFFSSSEANFSATPL